MLVMVRLTRCRALWFSLRLLPDGVGSTPETDLAHGCLTCERRQHVLTALSDSVLAWPWCAQVKDSGAKATSTLRKIDEVLDLDVVRRHWDLDAAVIETAPDSLRDVLRRASASRL